MVCVYVRRVMFDNIEKEICFYPHGLLGLVFLFCFGTRFVKYVLASALLNCNSDFSGF